MVLVRWFGHSAFLIEGSAGRVLIDPYLNENPASPVKAKDIRDVDLILVTHGHGDHLGDAVEIAQSTKAKVIGIYELALYLSKFGVDTIGMNYGGTVNVNGIKVSMVPAWHSSSFLDESGEIIYLGNPAGFVVEIDDRVIYHAGDTMIFKDMELIRDVFGPIDLALLPIGGRFVMDVDQALKALDLLKPKYAMPMHYNTWSLIRADPYYFQQEAEKKGVKVFVPSPGEAIEI
jgi:L-ascorbate metabolism protein UlaG (beta-lactamase superfamily)